MPVGKGSYHPGPPSYLFHDPFKAAYSYTEPHWVLRLTEAHTAVLINGKGHQYHDGHQGTNASWAEAKVVSYKAMPEFVIATSDASEAYRLVNASVQLVMRTVVFLRPDILLLIDRIRMSAGTAKVELRFQVDNCDGKGTARADGGNFRIERPNAHLYARLHSDGPVAIRTATLNVPAEHGVHPFVEVESSEAPEHVLLTVCTAAPRGTVHGTVDVSRDGNAWRVAGRHNSRAVNIVIRTDKDIPEITIL